ncbi:MAG: glycosyltransferase family 4 protein [Saprospiraceae bacterium]
MKIIFLSTCYPQKDKLYNGIFIHRQAKALQELGIEVHVIQPVNWFPPLGLHVLHPYWSKGWSQLQQMEHEVEGVKIHHPKMFIKMPSRYFPEDNWELMGRSVGRYINTHTELKNADWIYAHFLCHEGYAGVFASSLTGIPLAAIARGDDVHAWPETNSSLVKNLNVVFREAELLLANSKQLAEDTKHWFEKDINRDVQIVYNGVDNTSFFPVTNQSERNRLRIKFELPLDKNLLICVATPVVLKGWIELLDAIQQLGNQFDEWKLIAVTPDWQFKEALNLGEEIARRGIQDYFIEKVAVPPSEMGELYRAMDAFVLPSYNEGISNAVVEAMASGLPTVTTNVGGHSEFIRHDENGILIPPRNVTALKESIGKIIHNEKFRNNLSREASKVKSILGSFNDNATGLLKFLKRKS